MSCLVHERNTSSVPTALGQDGLHQVLRVMLSWWMRAGREWGSQLLTAEFSKAGGGALWEVSVTLKVCCELLAGFIQPVCVHGFIFVVFYFGIDCPKDAGSSLLTLSWLPGGPPHRAHAGSTRCRPPPGELLGSVSPLPYSVGCRHLLFTSSALLGS